MKWRRGVSLAGFYNGIPSTVDYVPYWATATGNHTLNAAFDGDQKPIPFDVLLKSEKLNQFIREPAKVFRTTFSKQTNTLANKISIDSIPDGVLQSSNYVDVTQEYWKTGNVVCSLNTSLTNHNILFACVFNGLNWQPAWWGERKNDSVTFENMCKGAVFLPMSYNGRHLIPAGNPVALGYDSTLTFNPTVANTHSITIKQLDKYLIFRAGAKYKLFYWANSWKLLQEKPADPSTKELVFEQVPKNALLLLVPDYSQHKERPFTIDEVGNRTWW